MIFSKNKNINPFAIKEGEIQYGKLKNGYRLDWVEESFTKKGGGKETLGRFFNFKKLPIIGLVLFLFLFIILARVAWLQIVKGDYYYKLAEGNRLRIKRIEARRGVIYDRNNKPLVRNIANFLLYFVPADLPKDDFEKNEIINKISKILEDVSAEEIKQILAQVDSDSLEIYQPLFITDNIDYNKAMLLYLEAEYTPGVTLSNRTRREYFIGNEDDRIDERNLSLSHILGYTSKINEQELLNYGSEYLAIDYIGKMGIEFFWENELKGISGEKYIEVDSLGREKKIISQKLAEDGHNLVLSLDIELQKKLEEILNKTLKKLGLANASAVIMDPNNGEILAMVSLPSYNNNDFASGISHKKYQELISNFDTPLLNRCIGGEYPSGSTIKPVMVAAALEEVVISEYTSFNSTGGISVGQWFFPDWRAGGHGITDARKAISDSVNTFFYYIGGGYNDFKGLGVDRIVKYGELFGLNAQSGIDLAGEIDGFLPSKEWKEEVKGEMWYIGDTYHLAIGQGDILVTPLQVANFISVFANGGILYRPHLVKQILTGDNKVFSNIDPVVVRDNFINNYNLWIIRQGMRQTVTSGSARSLQSVPVSVAGKTGTAQWSTKKEHHAWFTGFAPYDNPEVVITILIEQGGEGSSTAVPVAKEVLDWYFGDYGRAEGLKIRN